MKYSIIIPTLNEENYVGILLKALSRQRKKDFEVIVVDGKSKDDTEGVVNSFSDVLNIQFHVANKKGVAYQRNYGVSLAKTDNLIFMDADGYIEPDFLSTVDEFLVNNKDIDILITWVEPLSERTFDHLIFYTFSRFYTEIIKKIKPAGCGAFMYVKREAFEKANGFREDVVAWEDMDLTARLHKNGFKYEILRNNRVKTSVRRLENMGRTKYIWAVGKGVLYYHLIGPIENYSLMKYVMEGGAPYKDNIKHNIEDLKTKSERIKGILFRKIF